MKARYSWEPTASQRLLLEAALRPADEANRSWQRWRAATRSLEQMDVESGRLLPFVHENLAEFIDGETRKVVAGVRRRVWFESALLFDAAREALQLLSQRGIEAGFLKGVASIVARDEEPGLRYFDDIDLWVPLARAREAIEAFEHEGWRLYGALRPGITVSALISGSHAVTYTHPRLNAIRFRQRLIDLHWRVFTYRYATEVDAELWRRASIVDWHGFTVRIPSPEDRLTHTVLHGACFGMKHYRVDSRPTLRWIVDCAMVLRKNPEFRWDRVEALAHRLSARGQLLEALRYLRDEMQLTIPSSTIRSLEAASFRRMERCHREWSCEPAPPFYRFDRRLSRAFWLAQLKEGGPERVDTLRGAHLAWRVLRFLATSATAGLVSFLKALLRPILRAFFPHVLATRRARHPTSLTVSNTASLPAPT